MNAPDLLLDAVGGAAVARPRTDVETMCGWVDTRGREPPLPFRHGQTAAWPAVLRGRHCDVAIDGWFVLDDRLQLGREPAEANAVLRAIEHDLDAFLARIDNGFFNLVVHDRRRRTTRFANDRFGGLPLYLLEEDDRVVYAATHAGLRELSAAPLQHDPVGLAELYWFGYQLGDRTSFRDVARLPAGSAVEIGWDDGRRTTTMQPELPRSTLRFSTPREAADHLHGVMAKVAASLQRDDETYAVKLSAGMDSRFIASAWPAKGLRSYTFAHPSAREAVLSARLAATLGTQHRFVPLRDDLFSALHEPIFERHGIVEWFHQSLVPAMRRDGVAFTLDGLAGDVIVGGLTLKRLQSRWRQSLGLPPDTSKLPKDAAGIGRLLIASIKVGDTGYRPMTPEAHAELDAHWPEIEADMQREVERATRDGDSIEQICATVVYCNRTRRHVSLQGTVCRPAVEALYPFLDRRFVELIGTLPADWVASKRLYLELFRRHYPRVRRVASTYSLLPFAAPPAMHVAGRMLRYALEQAGVAASLALDGRRHPLAMDSMQWRRWLLFEPLLQRGARAALSRCTPFAPEAYDDALARLKRKPLFSGTRFMYTASWLLYFRRG